MQHEPGISHGELPVSKPCARGECATRETLRSLQACTSPVLTGPCSNTLNFTCTKHSIEILLQALSCWVLVRMSHHLQ